MSIARLHPVRGFGTDNGGKSTKKNKNTQLRHLQLNNKNNKLSYKYIECFFFFEILKF